MDPADFDRFKAHLAKQNKWRENPECPICGTKDWHAHGPLASRTLEWEQNQAAGIVGLPGPNVFAIALLICKKCHFLYQFAWRPIEEGRDG